MNIQSAKDALRVRPVSSFVTAVKAVYEIIDMEWLMEAHPESGGLWTELGRIIADVYMHSPNSQIVIDGEVTSFSYVQELFLHLTSDNLVDVRDRLERYPREIRFKKAFIRTALYNTLFETEIEAENLYAVAHCIPASGDKS